MQYSTIDDLMKKIDASGRSYDWERILEAYRVVEAAHKGQCRVSG